MSKTWMIGSEKVRRTVAFCRGSGIHTTSLAHPATGRDLAGADRESTEFLVAIDGTSISGADPGLSLRDARVDSSGGSTRTVIELERDGLLIELCYSSYEGMPVIRKGIRLKNITDSRSFGVDGLFASERLAVAMCPDMRVLWVNGITDPVSPNVFSYLDYGLEERVLEPGAPRVFTTQMPRDMSHLQEWRRGKLPAVNCSNHSYFPWIVLWDPGEQEGLYFGLEWSGPWRVELSPSPGTCLVTAGLGADFRHVLGPGESIAGVDLFEGVFTGGVEEAGADTQFFVEKHLAARAPFSLPPSCWNSYWALSTDIGGRLLRDQADEAARLGFEAFVVDYGWSRSAGDKREPLESLPSGMAVLSKHVKGLGMLFGLWVAPAAFDPKVAPTRDPHEWFIRTEEGTLHDEGNIAHTCACLASDYRHYVKEELDRIVTDYDLDWLKFDQNMFINCYATDHEHQNEQDAVYFQVLAFYEILDYLMDRHPNLIIECALSGALILDFGVVQRTHTAWLHDDHRSYFVRRCFYGASYPLAPRFCTTCTAHPATNWDASAADLDDRKDSASRRGLFDYFYRASVMGVFNVSDDLLNLPPEARESLERAIELHKTVRRRIRGPIRHILPQPRDPREWDAVEVYDERLREGMVFVFRPSSPIPETTIRLTGLDAMTSYEVRSENHDAIVAVRSGGELMKSGLQVRIEDTSGSEVLCFRALCGNEESDHGS